MRLKTCKDTKGSCFARTKKGGCRILTDCPARCGFRKPDRLWTKGRCYPDKDDAAEAEA